MSVGAISAPPPHPRPQTQRSSFISRAGMNSLMTNRTISFVESSQKYVFLRLFCTLAFIPPPVAAGLATYNYEGSGTNGTRFCDLKYKNVLIWNLEWCLCLLNGR